MKRYLTRHAARLPLVVLLAVGLMMAGCANLSNTEKGAAAGAGAGAVIGGAIGKTQDNTAKGAIIGAVVGGTAGAIIGQQMDEQAAELDEELEGAEVVTVENPETGETAGIQVTFDSAILFDFDSAALRNAAEADLTDLSNSLVDYPNTDVLVVGHTDAIGEASYNQQLSERRAASAATYLRTHGISAGRITTIGRGERDPVATNEPEYARQQNRRVEIAIYASEEYREELEAQYGG